MSDVTISKVGYEEGIMAIDPQALTIQVVGWESELALLQRIKAICKISNMSVEAIIQEIELMITAKEALVRAGRLHLPPNHSNPER